MVVFDMLNRKTMLLSGTRLLRVWVLSAPKDAACEWLVGGSLVENPAAAITSSGVSGWAMKACRR